VESIPDDRSIDQRRHDAFEHGAQRLLAAGDLPATAGVPTTFVISMTLDQLEARAGQATTHHGGHLSVQAAMRLGVDVKTLPVVFDQHLGTLAYGRARRLASPGQRLALFARDKGCTQSDLPPKRPTHRLGKRILRNTHYQTPSTAPKTRRRPHDRDTQRTG